MSFWHWRHRWHNRQLFAKKTSFQSGSIADLQARVKAIWKNSGGSIRFMKIKDFTKSIKALLRSFLEVRVYFLVKKDKFDVIDSSDPSCFMNCFNQCWLPSGGFYELGASHEWSQKDVIINPWLKHERLSAIDWMTPNPTRVGRFCRLQRHSRQAIPFYYS